MKPPNQRRHCERSEAIQNTRNQISGLLRCARNDVLIVAGNAFETTLFVLYRQSLTISLMPIIKTLLGPRLSKIWARLSVREDQILIIVLVYIKIWEKRQS
jgi:hypothetical protein